MQLNFLNKNNPNLILNFNFLSIEIIPMLSFKSLNLIMKITPILFNFLKGKCRRREHEESLAYTKAFICWDFVNKHLADQNMAHQSDPC